MYKDTKELIKVVVLQMCITPCNMANYAPLVTLGFQWETAVKLQNNKTLQPFFGDTGFYNSG